MPKSLHEQYIAAQDAFNKFVLEHAGLDYSPDTYRQLDRLRQKIWDLRAKLEKENQNAQRG